MILTVLIVVSVIILLVIFKQTKCNAIFFYDKEGKSCISYNETIYYNFDDISVKYENIGILYGYQMLPYKFTANEMHENKNKIYINQGSLFYDLLNFSNYFCFYSKHDDLYSNFIIKQPNDSSVCQLYVKKNFVFPTIHKNKLNEVWLSLSSFDTDNIKDSDIVNKIVECVKSEGEIALDKEIVDYIKKYSWDNHCFYLKYEGYPLVEEFHIEETEDGRYIVDQYTAEEYDTIYWDEH